MMEVHLIEVVFQDTHSIALHHKFVSLWSTLCQHTEFPLAVDAACVQAVGSSLVRLL